MAAALRQLVSPAQKRRLSSAAEQSSKPSCGKCGQGHEAFAFVCSSCGNLMELDTRGATHFAVMGLPQKFAISASEVETAYKALQNILHPDRHARAGDQSLALAEKHSARVNEAVAVLRTPLKRVAYWMELKGVRVLEEDQRMEDMETMMEVMETSEEIDAARTQAEVDALTESNAAKMRSVEDDLVDIVEQEDWQTARQRLERLQMLTRISERLNDWRPK